MLASSGDKPPCMPVAAESHKTVVNKHSGKVSREEKASPKHAQKIFSSMMAAMGKQLKQSVNVFHNLMLYRRLHSS